MDSSRDINLEKVMVKIHGLSFFEGHGVGRSKDGKVYFVDLACPGDTVVVKPYKSTNKFSFATIVEMIEPSPLRVTPPCPVFGKCGGCSLQHVDYNTQLEQKQFVLKRYHTQKKETFELAPFEAAEKKFNYRNRMEVHVQKGCWGLYQKKSHNLVYPKDCKIVDEKINDLLNTKFSHDGHYHVDLSGISPRTRGSEGVFRQVNPEINKKLKDHVLHLVKQTQDLSHIFDLFAGSGNYSLFLASHLPDLQFTAVEISRNLIDLGKKSSKDAKALLQKMVDKDTTPSSAISLSSIEWVCADVNKFLKTLDKNTLKKSLFLVNPPRNGLEKSFIQTLKTIKPQNIIYVSCNPMTLFRDIDAMSPNWSLKTLKGFDMFPQTMHFETVALLSRV